MLCVKQSDIKDHFLSLWYNSTLDPLANTLTNNMVNILQYN